MKVILKYAIPVMMLILLVAVQSQASVVVQYNNGTTNSTAALTGFTTNGDMMNGMNVTAFFTSGGSQTLVWGATGLGSGGVTGTGWSLGESGDTFLGTWTLQSSVSINKVFIDAGPGDTVYDINTDPNEGTPGSARGTTFAATGGTDSNFNIVATYIDLVALNGFAPVGDLWRKLNIDFTNTPFTGRLTYVSDTDNLKFGGDLQPVPEPSTILLFGAGLAGLGIMRRRFKK